jgi:DNA-binding NarL/FixJ family response regulator
MNKPLRLLIADDHEIVRAGLRTLLESVEGWTVCAEAGDGRSALTLAKEHAPDIAILDISMKQMNGIEAAHAMRKACPHIAVLILSIYETDQHVTDALAAGALGYVIKEDSGKELIRAVEALGAGQPFFSSGVAAAVGGSWPRAKKMAKSPRSCRSASRPWRPTARAS